MKNTEILKKIRAMFEEVGDTVDLPNGEYEQSNGDIWVVEDGKIVEIKKAEAAPEETPEAPVENAEETPEEEPKAEETPAEEPAPAVEEAPVDEMAEKVAQLENVIAEQQAQINSLMEAIRMLKENDEEFKAQFKSMEHKPSAQSVAFGAEKSEDMKSKLERFREMRSNIK